MRRSSVPTPAMHTKLRKTKECRALLNDQASSHHAKDHRSCTFTKSLISRIQDIVKNNMRSPCSSISIVRKERIVIGQSQHQKPA